MPDMANIHVDVALTNLSVAYVNPDYIADKVFPVVPVEKRSDLYFLYNKDSFLKGSGLNANNQPKSTRRPGTRSVEILYDVARNPYYANQMARNYSLTDAETKYADAPLQPAIDATLALTNYIMIDNELAVAYKAGLRANYPSSHKAQLVTNTTSWAAGTIASPTSFPISRDFPNAKKAINKDTARTATSFALNYAAAVTLSQNYEYLDKIKYTSTEGLTAAGLAPIIGGLTPIEGSALYVNSAEGATVTTAYIWTDDQGQDDCLFFYNPPVAASLKTLALGLTFEAPDDTLNARGFLVKRWREEWIDSEKIEVRTTRDWRFIATDGSTNGDYNNGLATAGYLLSGVTL
jgi:hypothetical protein